jgi:hypothetical protein
MLSSMPVRFVDWSDDHQIHSCKFTTWPLVVESNLAKCNCVTDRDEKDIVLLTAVLST